MKRKPMTKSQSKIYTWIEKWIAEKQYPPTVREIGEAFEITVNGVRNHLNYLESKGYITRVPKQSRTIVLQGR